MTKGLGFRKRLALELFSRMRRRSVAEHRLTTLFWECTLRCNLSCRHCGSDCTAQHRMPDMPKEDFFRVLDSQITPNVDPHKVMIILSGGEVLVREDLEQIGRGLYDRGYAWGMVTNGLALDRARFDSLLAAGLHSISVSLDGFESTHNYIRRNPHSFARAVEALRMIAAEPSLVYDVVSCITSEMIDRLDEFKEFLLENGIRNWRIFTIFPVGRASADDTLRISDEQFARLLDFIERTRHEGHINVSYSCEGFLGRYEASVRDHFYHCAAGVSIASIRVDGQISGCTSIRANYNQGNIYTDDFWDVWQNRFGKFRDREWMRCGECGSCDMFRYCQGGGMHLRGEGDELLLCHYKRLR